MSFLLSCIKPYKNWYLITLLGPVIGGFYSPVYNYAIKLLINTINASSNFGYSDIVKPIFIFILARLLLDIGWKINEFARLAAEPLVKKSIVLNAYNIIQNSSYIFFQNHNSGNITSKIKGLIDSYEALSKELLQSGLSSRMCKNIISILAIAVVNFWLGLFIFIWSFLFMFIIFKLSTKLSKLALIDSQEKHTIIGIIGDKITNILSVLLFSAKQKEYNDLADNLDSNFVVKQKNLYKYSIKLQTIAGLLYMIKFATVIFVMIYLKKHNLISIGDFAFVFGVLLMLADGIYQATISLQDFIKAVNDWRASVSILEGKRQEEIPHSNEIIKGNISFNKITFYHNNTPVFENFSLNIKQGEKVGIIGQSGSGKSTLVNLLLRFFEINGGNINIGNQNIIDINLETLRNSITLIPQDTTLFHKTIYENISYAKQNTTKEEVIEAAKKAHIHDFIINLEHGYYTQVGERGGKLSGGQKQRIIIARAILKNSPILILDEATSALDQQTEKDIQASLDYLMQCKTVIVIAHKLNTLTNMDRIVILDKSRVVNEGRPEDVITKTDTNNKQLGLV